MTRQNNRKKKSKKNKEESKSGNDRGKADKSKKQKISSILSCRSNAEVSGDECTEDPANSWRETGATNINNDVYDKVGGRDHNEVSTVQVDPMPKDVVHRTFARGHQQTIGDKGLLMQSTVRKEVNPVFERSPEEKTDGLYKTELKAGTKMKTDHKQCINFTEKKQYSNIGDTQKTGPRGIHLKGHNWKEDEDHLLEDDSNSFRMLIYENLSVAANGNLGTDKQVNNHKWNSSTESSNDNNVTEISDWQDSKKETKNSSICSGDSLLEPNLGKHESTMIDCKYESLQKLSLDVDGEENMYNPINPLYENIYREPDVSLSTSLESVTVPLLIDEYANKEWRGGTVKAAQIRRVSLLLRFVFEFSCKSSTVCYAFLHACFSSIEKIVAETIVLSFWLRKYQTLCVISASCSTSKSCYSTGTFLQKGCGGVIPPDKNPVGKSLHLPHLSAKH